MQGFTIAFISYNFFWTHCTNRIVDRLFLRARFKRRLLRPFGRQRLPTVDHYLQSLFKTCGVFVVHDAHDYKITSELALQIQHMDNSSGIVVLNVFIDNPINNTNPRLWLRQALNIRSNSDLGTLLPQKSKPYIILIQALDLVPWSILDKEKFVRALATESCNCSKFIVLLAITGTVFIQKSIRWNQGQKIYLLS